MTLLPVPKNSRSDVILSLFFFPSILFSVNTYGMFGCCGGIVIGMVMIIRIEWNKNAEVIMLFGMTFGINNWMIILMFDWYGMEWN